MESVDDRRISTATIVGLVVVIAGIDVFANILVPEPARVPVKLGILCALVAWARRSAGLSWDELGLDRARLPRDFGWADWWRWSSRLPSPCSSSFRVLVHFWRATMSLPTRARAMS